MENNRKIHLLFLLLALPCVSAFEDQTCATNISDQNLFCYNDFNRTISCVWNSTYDHPGSVCTIHVESIYRYSNSCQLQPVDFSRPTIRECSVVFKNKYRFQTFHTLTINLSCNTMNESLSIAYIPHCHVRLNSPLKPEINYTTVSLFSGVAKHVRFSYYYFQLQLRQQDQPWKDPPLFKECDWYCNAQLPYDLIKGESYEARVRVKPRINLGSINASWSDWSPVTSFVAQTGVAKPTPPPPDFVGSVLGTSACVVAFVLMVILIRTDRTTWIYIIKKLRGPPLPNPGKSFLQDANFQNMLSPHFSSECFSSFMKPVEIVPVEVTSTLVVHSRLEAVLQDIRTKNSDQSTSSNFSNPIYSQLSPRPPPLFPLTLGKLQACDADTPYGPVGCHGDDNTAEQDRDEVRGKEVPILQLFSEVNSEPMLVISDYEKVERLPPERLRLQSLDSGVGTGEESSQESLEADSISMTPDGSKSKEETEGGEKLDFLELFRGSASVLDKGSIQVCSGYEQIQKVQDESPELHSLDSGINSGGEEQLSQEESPEDDDNKPTESTGLLFTPTRPFVVEEHSLSSFAPLSVKFSGATVLQPPPGHILERLALMSTNRSVGAMEPSGDGYLPVSQEYS